MGWGFHLKGRIWLSSLFSGSANNPAPPPGADPKGWECPLTPVLYLSFQVQSVLDTWGYLEQYYAPMLLQLEPGPQVYTLASGHTAVREQTG